MDAYRKVWICLAVAVLGLGLAAAAVQLALMSPAASAVLLVVAVVLTRAAGRLPARVRDLVEEHLTGPDATLEVRATAALPVLTVACLGLDAIFGAAGFLLVLLVGLARLPLLLPRHAPLTVADILAEESAPEPTESSQSAQPAHPPQPPQPWVPRARGEAAVTTPTPDPAADPDSGELTPSELCHAWQASYRAMLMSADPAERARIAAARGRYLDALAEWDPDGFTRWMESGTAAAGDPSAHLGHGAAHPPEQE